MFRKRSNKSTRNPGVQKPKPSLPKKESSNLSFGDDEEEEVFTVSTVKKKENLKSLPFVVKPKKTNDNHKKTPNISTNDNLFHSRAGEYTKEKLNNLKAQNKFISTPPIDNTSPEVHNNKEPIIFSDDDETEASEYMIPTTHAIARAKQKREQFRRATGNDEEFIPLDSSKDESRIIRDSIHDRDDDPFADFRDREKISFGDPGKDKKRIEINDMMDIDDIDEDPDGLDWEKQQLKKIGLSFSDSTHSESYNARGRGIKLPDKPGASVTSCMSQIQAKIARMKEQQISSAQEAARVTDAIKMEKNEIETLKTKLEALIVQNEELSSYKSFIHDLMKCFELNLPTIDKLEATVSETIENYLQLLQEMYNPTNDETPKFDEFGRDINLKQSHKRNLFFEHKNKRRMSKDIMTDLPEGFSSDDETNFVQSLGNASDQQNTLSDTQSTFRDFIESMESPLCQANAILQEDLPSLSEILEVFTNWKQQHPSAYESAYCEKTLWATLSPIVRTQLIFWDPLLFSTSFTTQSKYHTVSFKEQEWFKLVEHNSLSTGGELRDKLVEEEVLPKIKDIITQAPWDVFSRSHNRRVRGIIQDLADWLKLSSIQPQGIIDGLLIKVLAKFYQRVRGLPVDSRSNNLYRLVKLLCNVLDWRELMPLQNLAGIVKQICEIHFIPFLQSSDVSDIETSEFLKAFNICMRHSRLKVLAQFPETAENFVRAIPPRIDSFPSLIQTLLTK